MVTRTELLSIIRQCDLLDLPRSTFAVDCRLIFDTGQYFYSPTTVFANFYVDTEYPLESLRPTHGSASFCRYLLRFTLPPSPRRRDL